MNMNRKLCEDSSPKPAMLKFECVSRFPGRCINIQIGSFYQRHFNSIGLERFMRIFSQKSQVTIMVLLGDKILEPLSLIPSKDSNKG